MPCSVQRIKEHMQNSLAGPLKQLLHVVGKCSGRSGNGGIMELVSLDLSGDCLFLASKKET